MSTAIRRTRVTGCCAPAARGHTTAAPPRRVMNSRRLMCCSQSRDCTLPHRDGKYRVVHHSKLRDPMSCPLSRPLSTTPDLTTSDRDPSACCLPAPFLQTTGTAAAAPASWLRTATNLRAICGRDVGLVFLFDRSLAKDFAGKIMDSRTSHAETSCCQKPLIVGGP